MNLRIRFMLLITVICLIATAGLAAYSYQFSKNNALREARTNGAIVYNYIVSSKDFFGKVQLPKIYETAGRNVFVPELMSSFAVARGVFETFQKSNQDFIFKQATINPLVPANKADVQEIELIGMFQKDKELTEKEGEMVKNGQKYYYYAKPIRVTDTVCLECHGDPAAAPEEQTDIYGTESGYNWKLGDTVSAMITYVPLQKALAEAKKSAATFLLFGAAGIVVLMLLLWIFFSRYVIKPIAVLEQRATEISLGKNLGEPLVATTQGDEIGALSRAIDRLRISVGKMLQRYHT